MIFFTTLMHLLQRFDKDVLQRIKLCTEDFKDRSNHKDTSLINIRFADKQLSKLRVKNKVSEQDVLREQGDPCHSCDKAAGEMPSEVHNG